MNLYVICAIIDQVLFLKLYPYLKHERTIKHAFLEQSGQINWLNIVTHAYICCIWLYMCALMLVACYQHKTTINIDIIGLNILYGDLTFIQVLVYRSKRCIAHFLSNIE